MHRRNQRCTVDIESIICTYACVYVHVCVHDMFLRKAAWTYQNTLSILQNIRQIDRQQTSRQADRHRQAGRQADRQTDTGRQADRQADRHRQAGRQAGRQTQAVRQADRQADRQSQTQTDTDRHTDRQTDIAQTQNETC